ncbi:MAG: shikimate kinase, partial [Thermomicrobiales bacterium]
MRNVQRVVLTGFSGSGKSTVALLLAAKLGWRPIDIDQDIEVEAGLTIPEIFVRDGETAFRELERRHLVHALEGKRVIIATGGGAVANDEVWTD